MKNTQITTQLSHGGRGPVSSNTFSAFMCWKDSNFCEFLCALLQHFSVILYNVIDPNQINHCRGLFISWLPWPINFGICVNVILVDCKLPFCFYVQHIHVPLFSSIVYLHFLRTTNSLNTFYWLLLHELWFYEFCNTTLYFYEGNWHTTSKMHIFIRELISQVTPWGLNAPEEHMLVCKCNEINGSYWPWNVFLVTLS